ncbi:transcriptional repressor [Nisaea acidiphila]|uniref:Transcriptional repressor n=1 Tax=Nisaea acidiphila TaxID=1862145 RepID=A0A9J7ARB8_9PROT|nr:Fur family transcriptional regulator [Nisaea acidiphila]UUX49750.1 transcriptional repressor [Nisaea acidiphila]
MQNSATSFPAPDHDHGQCLDDALSAAERLCAERGVRITPARRRVLELVWQRHAPIGAYDILSEMQKDADREGKTSAKIAPPTVYRALEFLMEQGLVHKVESQNAYIGCSHPEAGHDCGFLICRECGAALEIEDEKLSTLLKTMASRHGFTAEESTVEIKGICPACKAGAA